MTSCFVIFGAAVRPNGEPSGTLIRRVAGAVAAAAGRSDVRFLCTGGLSAGGHVEADVMHRLLLEQGISASSVLLEREGSDTLQQIRLCDAIMRGLGDVDQVVPCTSRYHIPRCAILLRVLGWTVRTAPMPGDFGLLPLRKLLWYYCKEVVALPYDLALLLAGPRGGRS